MHKAKTSKLLISVLAVFSLVFGGILAIAAPANAAACGGAMPTVELVTDPIMYSGISAGYNANYIGYKLTGGSTPSTSSLTIKLDGFGGSARVALASSQADTQTVGALATNATKYIYFLAAIGTPATAAESHNVTLTDGVSTCTDVTTLNPATSVNPAATSNASNKVDSITVGTAPNAVGGTITVTVKGDTGTVGTNEGLAFAPVSYSSFPANKWTLTSVTLKLNQDNSWVDQTGTETITGRLYVPYLPYSGATYTPDLKSIDGNYTATYVFTLIAATSASTQMKPIQYVGNVYTGTVPGGTAPAITSTAAVPAITPSTQTVSGTSGSAITATTAFTPSNFSAGTIGYTISPSLPAGLSISSSTGVISGTPSSTSASTSYTVTATNASVTSETATSTVTISVAAAPTPAITPGTQTVTTTVNTAITATTSFTASNFGGTVTYAVSPALPAGLTMSTSTGVITGTPTATQTATSYTVTASGSSSGSATATVSITVNAAAAAGGGPTLDRKVTICHRTHATTNPYVRITVDYNSVNKKSGHQGHDEIFAGQHVFKAGIYVRAKDKDWGDIIPADPTGFARWQPLNWTTLGAQIYNGTVDGCPSYDPVKYYNALRESGVPEKKIKQEIADLETEQAEAKPETKKTNITDLKYTGTDKKAQADEDKVTICHRTNSTTNPYVKITVAAESIYKTKGHYSHDEIYNGHHVFDSTVAYPNNQKDWGDIIPADATGQNRWAALNMTTLGKKIYDGTVAGCAEKTTQELYNELREEGKSKKEIMADLEKQGNLDEDPKDLDELEYTGNDPEVEKSEPKEPTDPNNPSDPNAPNKVKVPDQSLSGIVWLDINKDGLKDPNEPLMKNIKLYVVQVSSIPAPVTPANLLINAGMRRANTPMRAAAVQQVLTDANGYYLFPSLGAGDWKVTTTVPEDLYVTYDSHESSDGEIVTTVPVSSHAFTWVGLVADTEAKTLEKLTEILKENPNALPTTEVPPALKAVVAKAKAAAAAKTPIKTDSSTGLAYTGTNDLAWLFFGVLLMLSGVALRFARTKQ